MAENFFTDNADLQFRLQTLDIGEALEIFEDSYRCHEQYPIAPRSYADAIDNYRKILQVLGEICGERIAPRADEADEEGAHFEDGRVTYAEPTREAMALFRQAGLTGAMLPYEYGGMNLPETVFQMMVEIVSRAEAGLMNIFGLEEIAATIAKYGDEAMKARTLPRFARGEVTGAMVLTEPDAGSDLGAVQTRATYDEEADEWRLNGVKRFITNGCGDILLVLARSEEGSTDARGLSLFEVEADETVHIRRIEEKLGIHTSPTCEIQFCDTPARLIGRRRFGLIRYAMSMMNGARIAVAAQALGIAEAAYRAAYDYAQDRVQFDRSIADIPPVYRMLLAMRGEIEATRALIYETGRWVDLSKAYDHLKAEGALDGEGRQRLRQAGRLADVLTPLAKYYGSEMANRVADQGVQIHGGTGYTCEFDAERHYRDARITNIYEGTSQLQIVAATGGLMGHVLDYLFEPWSDEEYDEALLDLKEALDEATARFNRAIDHLKEMDDQAVLDYYAADLADVGVGLVTNWLLLRDARLAERKRALARVHINETLPLLHGKIDRLRAVDPTPTQVKELVLAEPF